MDECCNDRRNECQPNNMPLCWDRTASSNYIYRLSPGDPERYEPTGGNANYQMASPYWPSFGSTGSGVFWQGDLEFGGLGSEEGGNCDHQGTTYRGSPNAACGNNHWGHTDLEVWGLL